MTPAILAQVLDPMLLDLPRLIGQVRRRLGELDGRGRV
jgi:hypothetical protein